MMTYKCRCELICQTRLRDDTFNFTQDIYLPFCPFIGLELHFPADDFTVDQMHWDVEEGCFVLYDFTDMGNVEIEPADRQGWKYMAP